MMKQDLMWRVLDALDPFAWRDLSAIIRECGIQDRGIVEMALEQLESIHLAEMRLVEGYEGTAVRQWRRTGSLR